MRPKGGPAYDPAKRCPRDMLGDRFFFEKVKAYGAIEAFQVSVFVKMLDSAANVINLAHHIVMAGADEDLGPAPELALGFARIG
jgi:hypothetical protein